MKKYTAQAFTFIEILVVVALISLASVPLIRNAYQSSQIQNLRTSASVFSDDLQSAKVSSREARDKKAWGVVSQGSNTYQVVKGTPQSFTPEATRVLENGITFEKSFSVWFEIGTGNATTQTVTIKNQTGHSYDISINDIGTITTQLVK